jgi:hypothetical protein
MLHDNIRCYIWLPDIIDVIIWLNDKILLFILISIWLNDSVSVIISLDSNFDTYYYLA